MNAGHQFEQKRFESDTGLPRMSDQESCVQLSTHRGWYAWLVTKQFISGKRLHSRSVTVSSSKVITTYPGLWLKGTNDPFRQKLVVAALKILHFSQDVRIIN
jgi:hypothetical protein